MINVFKNFYSINLEVKEYSVKGWNWGKTEFGGTELAFNVQNRPAFEVPYSKITNTNLAGKNEVAVEFGSKAGGKDSDTNGHLDGLELEEGDELVEMRFYIPGTSAKKGVNEEGEEVSVEGSDAEEQNAANFFYDTLMDKAEIGEVAGDTFATFQDILHLTPRCVLVHSPMRSDVHADMLTGDASTSICMRLHSDFAERPMTTRYSTRPSRSSCCFLNPTSFIP